MKIQTQLVLFDFDGVIVDTARLTYSIRKEMEPSLSFEEFLGYFKGNIHKVPVKRTFTETDVVRFGDIYLRGLMSLHVRPGLEGAIRALSSLYTLVIVSSTASSAIESFLYLRGLRDCFSGILGSDFGTDKTIKMSAVLKEYGSGGDDAVYITDTLGDVLEASACGIQSIAVTWGFHTRKMLEEGHPTEIVDAPHELPEAVHRIFSSAA